MTRKHIQPFISIKGIKNALLFSIVFFNCVVLYADNKNTNILVLHSYHNGLSWTDNINKGISESFGDSVEIRREFMDTKRFEDDGYFKIYKDYLASKYQGVDIDCIICSDNAAFDFLSQYRNEIFGKVPVSFCGVNYYDSIPEGFSAIVEELNYEDNLKAIVELHPHYNKLYIINDRSITGSVITKRLKETINKDFPDLRYELLTDYTLVGLQNKLASLNPDDVVLLMLFNFDREGNIYSFDAILDYLIPYCNVPIYGTWDFYLGKGIVGGRITDAHDHGHIAGNIAKELLKDKGKDTLIIDPDLSHFVFDYKILKKYHISKARLPKGSKIINSPYEFFLKNRALFSSIAAILILLILIINILYFQKKHVKKYLRNEKEMSLALEAKSDELQIALKKAEESNRLKSRFLSNISHEVRTPLNGIVGFSKLLPEAVGDKQRLKNFMDIIVNSGKQLVNIIDDILSISIIESEQVKVNNDIVQINSTLMDTINIYSTVDSTNEFILGTLQLKDGDDKFVTDNIKFKQILKSLTSNANKFTENGKVEIGYAVKGDDLEFYVKDTGIGIDKKDHAMIFERFKQVEQDDSKIYGGNGLGLSISKAYVEILGGEIHVESELGKGATFFFTLPFNKTNLKQKSNLLINGHYRSKKNVVLIAEDDNVNFMLLQEILKNQTKEIIRARNGKEAVDIVMKRDDINFILMDLNMPVMDGYKAAKTINSLQKNIPIIAQSAFVSQNKVKEAIDSGCVDFIPKPIEKDELFKKMDEYIN